MPRSVPSGLSTSSRSCRTHTSSLPQADEAYTRSAVKMQVFTRARDIIRFLELSAFCLVAQFANRRVQFVHYIVDHALSIGIEAPLIIFASSEAKKATPRATSSTPMIGTGVPSLSFETWSCTMGLRESVIRRTKEQTYLQEGVETCRIKMFHLHGRCDVCCNTTRKNCIAPNAVLVKAPCDIFSRSDL
jgi:hypothetical protein